MKAFNGDEAVKADVLRQIRSGKNILDIYKIDEYLHPYIVSLLNTIDFHYEGRVLCDAIKSIRAGADLSNVWYRFVLELLTNPDHGVCTRLSGEALRAVEVVANMYRLVLDGGDVSDDAKRMAIKLVDAEQRKVDALSPAYSALSATEMAAQFHWATNAPGVFDAARHAARSCHANEWFKDTLLRLLSEAPVQ